MNSVERNFRTLKRGWRDFYNNLNAKGFKDRRNNYSGPSL